MVSLKARQGGVSPRTIRKRILKAGIGTLLYHHPPGVSPRTIRKRILKGVTWQDVTTRASVFHPARSVRGY